MVNVDGLWQEGVELEGGDTNSIESRVTVDRSHNVQPGLEMKLVTTNYRTVKIDHNNDEDEEDNEEKEDEEEGSDVGERIDFRLIDDCVHKVQPRLMMTWMGIYV